MTQTPGPQDRYQKIDRIAVGGMGEVWRARDTMLGRDVALKLLKPEFASDATFRSRFEDEARHAARLHHPGIASVFDVGEDATGTPYLVMELVDGQPLSALIRSGEPMQPESARKIVQQAAEAVAVAHAAGVIHRDVKPANLLITPRGSVKVTDFGIARAAGSATLTQTGEIMGSPHYLSPEQAEGTGATTASDVYSLGVVLYECLTGTRPFSGDNPVATALAHVRQPAPPLPADIPADIAAVCVKAMAKNPADRYPDAAAMAAALSGGTADATMTVPVAGPVGVATQVVEQPMDDGTRVLQPVAAPTGRRPPPEKSRSSMGAWWALLAVIALLAVGLLVWSPWNNDSSTEVPPATQTPTQSTSPTASASAQTVPIDENEFIGRSYESASNALQDLGMRVYRAGTVANDGSNEVGTVASLTTSGDLAKGTRIGLKVYGTAPKEPTSQPSPTSTPTSQSDQPTAPSDTPTTGDGTSQSSSNTTTPPAFSTPQARESPTGGTNG